MALHESGEDYLEAILMLQKEKGYVRSIDVAQHLGYSKPSVSRAMSILKASGHIIMERDGRWPRRSTSGTAGSPTGSSTWA